MIKNIFNEKLEVYEICEDWTDGDRLTCIKCDRFIDTIDEEGLCLECSEAESPWPELEEEAI